MYHGNVKEETRKYENQKLNDESVSDKLSSYVRVEELKNGSSCVLTPQTHV